MAHNELATLQTLSDGFAALSAMVWPSLVQIRNGRQGIGSGAIVRADGLIVTNAHVVTNRAVRQLGHRSHATTVALMDGREAAAQVIAVDPEQDLAALTVALSDLKPIAFADSATLRAGDLIIALGFPWGVAGGVTSGVIIDNGWRDDTASTGAAVDVRPQWLTASLHLRPGHSGGPMVDSHGRLVGINTMMNGPDVGVAIPAHIVARFLKGIDTQRVARVSYL